MSRSTRRLAGVAVAGICATALAAPALAAPAADNPGKGDPQGPLLNIQILSFNDFHGNLEPPTGSSGRIQVGPLSSNTVDAGGVEYLATHLKQARVGHDKTVTVAAGDMVGASPLLSAAFHDEPTVEALNDLGLEITAVGNHEFDEGFKELQRLQEGGCIDDGDGMNNQNSCPEGTFTGATFQYLAANVVETATGQTILPSYAIKTWNGAKIGFIGMTLKDTPSIVTASGVAGLEFKDEVQTANALVPVLKAKGVNAIVVLIHQGGTPPSGPYTLACQGGGQLAGDSPIIPIARDLDPAIDMIISGHTHQPYVCSLPDRNGTPRLVTSASSFGRLYNDTEVTYDRRTQDIVRPTMADSVNEIVTRTVTPDPTQTALIAKYKKLVTAVASRIIGTISGDITRAASAGGEQALGDLIADAQLADSSVVTGGKTPVIAFMNPGGIRTELTYSASKYGEAPGAVTYEEAFNVQPFNNYLVSMDLTGQQIYDLLNQQWSGANSGSASKVLQISKGFTYTWTGTTTPPSVVDGTVALNGTPIDKASTYRIVTNNFLSDGGDNFPAFKGGMAKYFGGLDIDAFATYLSQPANANYTPAPLDRITKQ
jgi:5'-nucleotidase